MISIVAESNKDGINEENIQKLFLEKYIKGNSAVKQRLNEQLVSSNFIKKG